MGAPVDVGLCRDEFHRYYWQGDGPLTSITTAIRAVDKSGPLVGWAKRLTAEAAVRNLDLLPRVISEGGPQAGIDFLKKLADYKRDKAADIGTRVHVIAEAIAREQPVELAPEEQPYVDAYRAWQAEWQPKFAAAEYMVCSLKHGYGGTGDGVVIVKGERAREHFECDHAECRVRFDTKTTKVENGKVNGPYAETALQLAAAEWADFSGRPGDPRKYRVPPADHHAVLHLRSDGTHAFVPYAVTRDEFEAFLAALRLWRWLQGPAKSVVGQPVQRLEAVA